MPKILKGVSFIVLTMIISCIELYAQVNNAATSRTNENWKTYSKNNYSINYPADWELNDKGAMGSTFFVFSKVESESDKFRENVNLLIQDLSNYHIDLEEYKDISVKQIKSMLVDAGVFEISKKHKLGLDYYKIVYMGGQNGFDLKFVQYYWVENKKAYVLTFTAEQNKFNTYWDVAEKILDSFVLEL